MCLLHTEMARFFKFYLDLGINWLGGNGWLVVYLLNGVGEGYAYVTQ